MVHEETIAQAVTDILVADDVISAETGKQIVQLFKEAQQEIFTDFMLEEEFVEKGDLLEALSEYYQVPWFDVEGYFFDHALLHQFPKGFLLRNNIIPLERDENILSVIASHPDNENLSSAIGEHVSYDLRFQVGLKRDINDAVKEFYDKAVTQVQTDEDSRKERMLAQEEEEIETGDLFDENG